MPSKSKTSSKDHNERDLNAFDLDGFNGKTITVARQYRHMTQRELGELCGMNQGDISKIENGRGNPSIKTLERIATALDCELVVSFHPRTLL